VTRKRQNVFVAVVFLLEKFVQLKNLEKKTKPSNFQTKTHNLPEQLKRTSGLWPVINIMM
jgi:hypothetical protein